MDEKIRNGSRLGEHRQRKVSPESWALLVILVVALLALVQYQASGLEPVPPFATNYEGHTGYVIENSHMCAAKDLSEKYVKLMREWERVMRLYYTYEGGGPELSLRDKEIFNILYGGQICATFNGYYPVVVVDGTKGYLLVQFDEQLEYGTDLMIINRLGFIKD